MQRMLSCLAAALSLSLAGCQQTTPAYDYPCFDRPWQAGLCKQPNDPILSDLLLGG